MRKSSADGPASALRRSKRCAPKRSTDNGEGALSASFVCPVTRGNVDLIQVAISFGFAENLAMLAFEVDPGDREPKFFGVTAERDGDRIADRDPRWQADVVIGPAGAGHNPTATFGQHTWAPRCYRLDGIGLICSSRAETASGNQEARNPDTKWHRPSPIECDMLKSALAIAAFQSMKACKCAATKSARRAGADDQHIHGIVHAGLSLTRRSMPRPAREMQCGVPLAFLIFGILSECETNVQGKMPNSARVRAW
jgi:hypothetical protein